MNTAKVEQLIEADVNELRIRFSDTQELYREVCALLFFRYGITPTANKLYQFVRKGSMSAPAIALKRFWSELREKSRARISNPDLPEALQDATGNMMSLLWVEACSAAMKTYESSTVEWKDKLEQSESRVTEALQKLENTSEELAIARLSLNQAQANLLEAEKKHAVDVEVSTALKKSLETLQIERDELRKDQEQCRKDLSKDIQTLNKALEKAEVRYRDLEARSLLEVDRERQRLAKAEIEIANLKKQHRLEIEIDRKEISKLHTAAIRAGEQLGKLRGRLQTLTAQNRMLLKENKRVVKQKLG